jgi:hypothetical protein
MDKVIASIFTRKLIQLTVWIHSFSWISLIVQPEAEHLIQFNELSRVYGTS